MNSEVCRKNNQNEEGQFLDLALSIRSMAEEPDEVEDAERAQSNKPAICVNDDPEEEDDCPKIINMGGNSEMVLNRGVSVFGLFCVILLCICVCGAGGEGGRAA